MKLAGRHSRSLPIATGVALGLSCALSAGHASTVVPPPQPKPAADKPTCRNGALVYLNCVTQGFFSPGSATATSAFPVENFNGTPPTTQNFKSAFDDWNGKQTTGVTWSLVDGGALDKVKLTVEKFTVAATAKTGGISNLIVRLALEPGYAGPTIDELVWSQGLYANWTPGGPFVDPPVNTLDSYLVNKFAFPNPPEPLPTPPNSTIDGVVDIGPNPKGQVWADPIYLYQYKGKPFGDAPAGHWSSASFRAIALLSTVSMTTDADGKVTSAKLTVYDGFSYGFDLSANFGVAAVPEPGTWLMLIGGFALLGQAARCSRAALVR